LLKKKKKKKKKLVKNTHNCPSSNIKNSTNDE
jgi:hypothetical protein